MKRGTNCTKAREDARAACCAGEVPFFAAADSEHRHEFRAFFQSKRKVLEKPELTVSMKSRRSCTKSTCVAVERRLAYSTSSHSQPSRYGHAPYFY
jgi:uncharacterized protein